MIVDFYVNDQSINLVPIANRIESRSFPCLDQSFGVTDTPSKSPTQIPIQVACPFTAGSQARLMQSEPKRLLDLLQTINRIRDRMSNRPRILVDLIVVASREALVAKEVNGLVVDPRNLLFILNVA